jgi:hypothetical protein
MIRTEKKEVDAIMPDQLQNSSITSSDVFNVSSAGLKKPVGLDLRWDRRLARSKQKGRKLDAEICGAVGAGRYRNSAFA